MTCSPPVHLLIDFVVDDPVLLNTPDPSMSFLRESVLAAGATILSEHTHQFSPVGFSGILILAQSHASIHTWAECRLVSIDIFACGAIDTEAAVDVLRNRFRPSSERIEICRRGVGAFE
ncbi:MAG TPA: adenosylmethionine decarboxylase [Candidatus Latescibacteria bacterium]|nr:adenosylmethionine decarboxylase [Candidatus Latescibacterota bacterium]HQE62668.1 adenosylmethionine decarboxylase [Candidatus Latescibacterota bacterium]HQI76893.1 adenosylmethionine decarboxylase [Candidatus Latescibacterota bacterium]HQK22938.1 adenosylmethionine decarboxylase [Candidatus Latescibacterota bacterium]HRU23249.1 adenosylmethionine decarboxylase [Candidatus Latescibacterota bacterium]